MTRPAAGIRWVPGSAWQVCQNTVSAMEFSKNEGAAVTPAPRADWEVQRPWRRPNWSGTRPERGHPARTDRQYHAQFDTRLIVSQQSGATSRSMLLVRARLVSRD